MKVTSYLLVFIILASAIGVALFINNVSSYGVNLNYLSKYPKEHTLFYSKLICDEINIGKNSIEVVLSKLESENTAMKILSIENHPGLRETKVSLFGMFKSTLQYNNRYGCIPPATIGAIDIPKGKQTNLFREPPATVIKDKLDAGIVSVVSGWVNLEANKETGAFIVLQGDEIISEYYGSGSDRDSLVNHRNLTYYFTEHFADYSKIDLHAKKTSSLLDDNLFSPNSYSPAAYNIYDFGVRLSNTNLIMAADKNKHLQEFEIESHSKVLNQRLLAQGYVEQINGVVTVDSINQLVEKYLDNFNLSKSIIPMSTNGILSSNFSSFGTARDLVRLGGSLLKSERILDEYGLSIPNNHVVNPIDIDSPLWISPVEYNLDPQNIWPPSTRIALSGNGQAIIVIPEYDAVIAYISNQVVETEFKSGFDKIIKYLEGRYKKKRQDELASYIQQRSDIDSNDRKNYARIIIDTKRNNEEFIEIDDSHAISDLKKQATGRIINVLVGNYKSIYLWNEADSIGYERELLTAFADSLGRPIAFFKDEIEIKQFRSTPDNPRYSTGDVDILLLSEQWEESGYFSPDAIGFRNWYTVSKNKLAGYDVENLIERTYPLTFLGVLAAPDYDNYIDHLNSGIYKIKDELIPSVFPYVALVDEIGREVIKDTTNLVVSANPNIRSVTKLDMSATSDRKLVSAKPTTPLLT